MNTRIPQRSAAASLKQDYDNASRDALSEYSAAKCCGLIEATARTTSSIDSRVFRSEVLRPH